MFQYRAVAASFHIAASGAFDALGFLDQVSEGYRIVASLPVNADQPEKGRGGLGGIMKHSPNGNGHGDSPTSRLVQDGRHRSRHLILSHSSHFLLSFGGAKLWKVMVSRIPASASACLRPECDENYPRG